LRINKKYNDARVFKDVADLRAFLKTQMFSVNEENPVHKVFKAADGTFLVHLVLFDNSEVPG
jgi:hypothetical protein